MTALLLLGVALAVPAHVNLAVLPPADVYGLNGSVAYTLYAENFAGSCWGERINAAITHAIEHGNGSGIVQLPPGDLNVSTPIRFARTARGDPCVQLNATRSIAAVWGCSHGATQADLPRGLTLLGTGGTSGDVYEGGTRLSWTGPPDNVMIELPAPWHCQIRRLTLHGLWVPRVTGIRYRAGWEFGTNGGKDNLFQDLNFEGLDIGLQIGDPLSPDLVGSVVERIQCMGARHCFVLYGANVAEIHYNAIHVNQFYGSGWLMQGTSGRKLRTRAQIIKNVTVPLDATGDPAVLTDQDDATEIAWEDLPIYAQQHCPALEDKPAGPTGGARVGGGGPTANIQNVVCSSVFCAAWLVDSNGPSLRLQGVRNEGCNGLYRNNGTHWPSNSRSRFTDMLIDVSITSSGSAADGNVISYHKISPLYIIGGSFHGPIATKANAKVFNMGASFDNWNKTSFGCLLDGYEWQLGPGSPFVKTGGNCTSGYWYSGQTGHEITAPPPSFRASGPAPVAFTSLEAAGGMPQVFAMQDATSGTIRVRPGTAVGDQFASVTLDAAMSDNKYQAVVTPRFNAGAVWVPTANRTTTSFMVMWEKPSPEGGELDWEVRAAPWPGNPTPLCCTDDAE